MTRFIALPLLTVIVLYFLVGAPAPVALGLVVLTLIPLFTSARIVASKAAQVVVAVAMFGGALTVLITLLAGNRAAPELLRTPWAAFTGAMLLVGVTRNYFAKPLGGDSTTIGAALCALAGCGGAQTEWIYPTFVLLFIVTAALARRRADEGRAPRASLGSKAGMLRSGAMLAICGAVIGAFVISAPLLYQWAAERFSFHMNARSGFTQHMWLGSMRGMLMSDRKVMRVHGDEVDYLRGIVYTSYDRGRWSRLPEQGPTPRRPVTSIAAAGDVVELRLVESEPSGYFLPLDAGEIAVSSGIAMVDRQGVVSPVAAEPAYRLQYRRTGERTYAVAGPDARDLEVTRSIRTLSPTVAEWTEHAQTPAEIADAIHQHLQQGYRYSLHHSYRERRDPVVEFVLRKKVGHCEYFASAMVMMLRLRGVPARLVGGYRVTEYNSVGDYYIVRERNAHAWVEAYLPDRGWTTYDPTPASELAEEAVTATSTFDGILDTLGSGWASFLNWLDKRTWAEMLGVPAVVIVLPLLVRIFLQRRKRRGQAEQDLYAQSLACFDELAAALGRRGFLRRASETIEQLALRLASDAETSAMIAREGPTLLRRYAALRYGGQGDRMALERDIRQFCAKLDTNQAEGVG